MALSTQEKLDLAIKTIEGARKGLFCVGTDANNDTCGVTFTCYPCRKRAELEKIVKQLKA